MGLLCKALRTSFLLSQTSKQKRALKRVNSFYKNLAVIRIEIDDLLDNYLNIYEEITENNYHQMKGHFFRIIMSQNGSRILQKCISKTSKPILSMVFREICNKLGEMLIDQYANYFCPKLYLALDIQDRLWFLNILKPKCVYISKSKVGTYPLQSIIESISTQEECLVIIDAFKNNILELCQVSFP